MNCKKYIAVVQAGGRGMRMKELTGDRIPKSMLPINGKPILEWQIEEIKKYGICDVIIITGYLGKVIEDYFGDGRNWDISIRYICEKQALGSAGALYYLHEMAPDKDFLLIFGDVMFEIDWHRFVEFHEQHAGMVTLLAHPNSHPYDSDLLVVNKENQVIAIDSKHNTRNYWYDNLVNSGIYILSSQVLEYIPILQKVDLEMDIIRHLVNSGKVFAYRTPEYVRDAGVPKRFYEVEAAFANGIQHRKCLNRKQSCVFLDRDGTLNIFRGLIDNEEDLELETDVAEALKKINQSGYLAIVITNQPVVARGLCDEKKVREIHRKLQVLLGNEGAFLDDIIFCPHHPDKGYPEENVLYKIVCDCRKPDTGMIDEMIKKYNIDVTSSYMIGDSTVDIMTGKNAGLKTILVKTGQAGCDGKFDVIPDLSVNSLDEAVDSILKGEFTWSSLN